MFEAIMNKKVYYIILFVLLAIGSCKHEPQEPPVTNNPGGGNGGGGNGGPDTTTFCDPDSIYFEQQVLPLIVSSCAIPGCHDPGTAEDNVILNSYENIMNTADVDPFDPEGSDLYEVITEDDPDKFMPPPGEYPPLSAEEVQLIQNWILQGAQNLSCESSCDTTNVTFSMKIEPIISTKCQGCHSGGEPQGGISLTNYAEVRDVALFGTMLDAVQHTGDATPMPYNSNQLPPCEVDLIRIWIENGAPQ